MTALDADFIQAHLPATVVESLADLRVLSKVDSTNSFLMQRDAPSPGEMAVAVTSDQTNGRGRNGKTWLAPPGSGVCLSAAYTFVSPPENLPSLTLAVGLKVLSALRELGIRGVDIKWPNDLVAKDGKLGGILTEVQQQSERSVTVVTGIGINVDLDADRASMAEVAEATGWARSIIDLHTISDAPPNLGQLTASLTKHLLQAFQEFASNGLTELRSQWAQYDWLFGRAIFVDTGGESLSGIGAGIDVDGALLLKTETAGVQRVTSGSVALDAMAGPHS